MAHRSDSSCRQCRGARHICPAGPTRATMILSGTGDEPWPLAGQELPACAWGPSRTSGRMRRAGLPGVGRLPVHARSAAVASGWSGPGQLRSRAGARGEGEDLADGGFLLAGSGSGWRAWIW
jgi:hypothetical protein